MQQILFLRPGAWRPALLTQQARGWLLVLLTLLAGATSALAQPTYCNGTSLGGGNTGSITSVSIASTPFSNSTFSTPPAGSYYTSYPASVTTATLQPGATYSFTVNLAATYSAVLWIDYNQNGVFDTSEGLQVLSTTTGGTTGTASFTVPTTATPGQTGLRIRTRMTGNTNDPSTSCLSYGSGETQDYVVTISSGAPCTTPPTPGTASASPANVCPGGTTTLTLTGASFGAGLTYQWQSSTTSATTGFTNISGATSSSYTTPVLTQTTYYRAVLTCSGQSATSNVVTVGQSPFLNCYCTPTYSIGGVADGITNVTLGTLNSASSATNSSPYYTDYASQQTGTSPTLQIPVLIPGATSNVSITFGTDGNQYSGVWVDFNQNGQFETTEYFSTGTNGGSNGTVIIPIVVPNGAITGQTKMRVRGGEDVVLTSAQACGASSSGYGEAEDYLVNVAATSACTGTPPAITATGPASTCPGTSYTLTASGPAPGTSGLTYQWQSSPTPTGTFTNLGTASASNMYTVASQTAATSYRVVVTCTASGQSATSNVVTVTVTPFLNCYCTPTYSIGGVADGITNVTLGSLNSSSSASNTTPYYTNYAPQQTGTSPTLQIPLLIPGTTSNISITVGSDGSQYSAVWVDFNQNGVFETTEYFSTGTNAGSSGTVVIPIVVPNGAITGQTKLRVRAGEDGSAPTSAQACGASSSGYGEAEDYLVNVAATVACSGTPTTITAVASTANACSNSSFMLTASGPAPGTSGLTYQWQSSPTPTGTFTNLGTAGASNTYTVASQTAATSYRVVVTCTASGQSSTSNVVTVGQNTFLNCYCVPTHTSTSTFYTAISSVSLPGDTGTLSNSPGLLTTTSPGYVAPYYAVYPATAPTTATLSLNTPYTLTVNVESFTRASAWIDFNQNGTFDASEFYQLQTGTAIYGTATTNALTATITPPLTAVSGATKMRIRTDYYFNNVIVAGGACTAAVYGETVDYTLTIAAPVACTGTPPTITATSAASSVCPATSFTLGITGITPGTTGLTYQWQSSPTPTGTFTNIGSVQTSGSYTVGGQTAATSYRVVVTCTASGQSSTSNVVTVGISPFLNCYCTPTYAIGGTADGIVQVQLNTLNSLSSATNASPYYTNYAPQQTGTGATLAIPGLSPGVPSNVSVTLGADGNQYSGVWIDFNQNGQFETTEYFSLGTNAGSNGTSIIPVLVPANALLGQTKMRVRGGEDVVLSDTQACGTSSSGYGEAEDYLVNIVPCTGGSPAAAAFSYGTAPSYCQSGTTPPVVVLATGASKGVFTATPTGLIINATTGAITLANSTPGTYTVTNTIVASGTQCASVNTTTITITAPPTATFSYPATPLTCANTVGTITPVLTAGATAGTFSLPTAPGLSINPTTGVVTVGTAAASGTYTVTNSIPSLNGCAPVTSTATFLLSLPPTSTFNYGAGTFCQNGLDPTPLITGTTGGTFTVSPATGLVLNSATGTISLFTSRGGTYTVTYTITTPCGVSSSTQTVSVTTQPTAGFTYLTGTSTGVGCAGSNTTVAPILLNGGVIGTFSVIPATGLTINASTGVISLATSAIGVYTVTNTIAATAGCGVSLNTSVFTVIAAPTTPTLTATANPQGGILLTASAATGVTYQFYLNGQPVSGATGQTYVVNSGTLNGTYTVTTTNAGGCSATSAAVPVAVTASASAQAGTSLTVYPNPTRDGLLTLELSGYREAVSWSLTNVLGQRLLEGTVSGNALTQKQALNLSALPTGVYLLQARTASGGLETRRIVRE